MTDWTLAEKINHATTICGDGRFTGDECRVLTVLILKFHHTKSGDCFPSYRQLATAAATSRRTAQRATAKAKLLGYISFEENAGGRQMRNAYSLETVTPARPLETETVTPARPCDACDGDVTRKNGDKNDTKGRACVAETVTPARSLLTQEVNTGFNTGGAGAPDCQKDQNGFQEKEQPEAKAKPNGKVSTNGKPPTFWTDRLRKLKYELHLAERGKATRPIEEIERDLERVAVKADIYEDCRMVWVFPEPKPEAYRKGKDDEALPI